MFSEQKRIGIFHLSCSSCVSIWERGGGPDRTGQDRKGSWKALNVNLFTRVRVAIKNRFYIEIEIKREGELSSNERSKLGSQLRTAH